MERVKGVKKENWQDAVISVIAVTAIVFFISRIYAIILISPDDSIYQNIMSGLMTGTPEGYCHFIRYPLAAILAFLYKITDTVAWYQLFLLGSLMLCFWLIFSRVRQFQSKAKVVYMLGVTCVILMFLTSHVVYLEWTAISGILGATAIYRYLTMPKSLGRKEKIWEYGICTFLLLLCFCLRNTVAFMMIPLAGICWLKKMMEAKNDKGELRGNITFMCVCLFIVGIVMMIHSFAYQREGWSEYKDYTKDRSVLFDYYGYPDYETYFEEYQKAGISEEALALMQVDYNFIIPCDNFENMDLKIIADLARKINATDLFTRFQEMFQRMKEIVLSPEYFLLHLSIFILIFWNLWVYRKKGTWDIVFILASVCWAIAMIAYLAFKGRVPERVIKSVDYGVIAVLLGNLCEYWKNTRNYLEKASKHKNVLSIIGGIVIVGGILATMIPLYKDNVKKAELAVSKMSITRYCKEHPDHIYLRDFWSFSQRGELFMRDDYDADNYLNAGGWIYHSPVYYDMLEYMKLENLYEVISRQKNVYYLVNETNAEGVILRLQDYFEAEEIMIGVEIVDEFITPSEKVLVLHFKDLYNR